MPPKKNDDAYLWDMLDQIEKLLQIIPSLPPEVDL